MNGIPVKDMLVAIIMLGACALFILGYTFWTDLQKNMQVPEYEPPFPVFTLSPDNYNYPGHEKNQ